MRVLIKGVDIKQIIDMSFLKKIKFVKDCRTFKTGDEIEFMPGMTAIVGINGCGKSTILDILRSEFKISDTSYLKGDMKGYVELDSDKEVKFDVRYHDFHAYDKKYSGSFGEDIEGHLIAMKQSSGIGGLTQFNRTNIKNSDNSLIIIDEPDRGLAIRLQSAFAKLLFDLCERAGNQVIVSTHSKYIMDKATNIYSVEHKKYFASSDEFLDEHMKGHTN